MNSRTKLSVAICSAFVVTGGLFAETTAKKAPTASSKVETVDLNKIGAPQHGQHIGIMSAMELSQATTSGKERMADLEKKQEAVKQKINSKQEEIKTAMNEQEQKKSLQSKTANDAMEARLVTLKGEYENLVKSSQYELQFAMQQATEELFKEIEDAAAQVARQHGYDMMLDVNTGRVMYASANTVVTDKVATTMNKNYEVAKAKNSEKKETVVAKKADPKKKATV